MNCVLWFRHKLKVKRGYGIRCARCGKTAVECAKDDKRIGKLC